MELLKSGASENRSMAQRPGRLLGWFLPVGGGGVNLAREHGLVKGANILLCSELMCPPLYLQKYHAVP